MASQYTILSVLIRAEIQEKISIGLLLFNPEKIYFNYSRNKLQISRKLLSAPSYRILKDILENIDKKVTEFNDDKKSDNTFSTTYLSYLSNYSNNVISFLSPKEIRLDINLDNFSRLFETYVDHVMDNIEIVQKTKPFDLIKNQYGERIKTFYDIHREVTHEQVSNLINPVRVDFSGRNEVDVYAQTVDMELGVNAVSNHINAFVQLVSTYSENEVPMHDFVIAKEPERELFPKQHDIWKQLRNSNILHYLDLSESEKIIDYAESHGVLPLSKASH